MNNSIPFLDLSATYKELKSDLDASYNRLMNSGWYILGDEVEAFELEYAKYCSVNHCIGVGNGLDALTLSLLACGVKEGDEVIVPANTYIATWLSVSNIGAIPIPVEPNEKTYNIDASLIEKSVSKKTRAIIPVHLYGQPAEIHKIIDIAKKYNLKIVEDGAQAHGAKIKGQRIGGHGDAVAWSFYPGKNLGGYGDGGAVTTNNIEIAEKLRLLRNYGSKKKYLNDICGFNSRLDPLQASFLRVKLKHLDSWNKRRVLLAENYKASIIKDKLKLPYVPNFCDPVWHLFVIQYGKRDELQDYLKNNKIYTMIHYPIPPYLQKAYKGLFKFGKFNITSSMAKNILSLPIGPHLTFKQNKRIIEVINNFLTKQS